MNRFRTLRLDQYFLGTVTIVVAVAGLIALTWFGTDSAITAQRAETLARVTTSVSAQAAAYALQINRQMLALDQTLLGMVRAWEANPATFDLESRRAQSLVLDGISRDMLLLDQRGIIRQSSVPETVGQDASDRDFFRYARGHAADQQETAGPFIGATLIDPVMRQWHLNVGRTLHAADGSFAGAVAADYRISAILDIFYEASIGANGAVMLVGNTDSRLRAMFGATPVEPNTSMAGSAMLAAVEADPMGLWTGPSAADAVRRLHAFRRLPGRDLTVIVALDEQEALSPAIQWEHDATLFAISITALLVVSGTALLIVMRQARTRAKILADERALLATANAELEAARAFAFAKTDQLEAAFDGMTDGIAMIDPHYQLIAWNDRFPSLAGIPSEMLRVGLPMEDVLRAQVSTGQFGAVDAEAEVARRMERLGAARFSTVRRVRPDGRVLELRRNRLPDGGIVTLYADVTENQRSEDALREARAMAEAANEAKSRFVAIVSHEIRTPLNALLNTLRLLDDGALAPSQRSLVTMASQSGDALGGLINDILEMSRFEAGQLTLRDTLFELRPLLEGALDMFRGQAMGRGLDLRLAITDDVPQRLFADAGRLRQVLLNLLSNAVKFARPGDVWVLVQRERQAPGGGMPGLRIMVRDQGPVIAPDARARLFRPFARLDQEAAGGTGLGLAICHHIITLMGGDIGCDAWPGEGAANPWQGGNSFWLTLPPSVLASPGFAVSGDPSGFGGLPRRPLPRTRVLLVEDVAANRIVTATLLRRGGHLVDFAASGEAAIRAVERIPYDIVFMDIVMPGMNGLEATQRLRASIGPGRTIPIVALTGSTGSADDATFRTAGMNAVLGKPVSLPELLSAMARLVWPGHPAGEPPARPPEAAPQPDEPVQEEAMPILAMDRIEELRANIPEDALGRLIESCLIDMEEMLPPFRRALDAGLSREISTQAHTLAGVAGSYGLGALETRLRGIMAAVSSGETDSLTGVFAAVEADFNAGAAALRALFQDSAV